MKAFTKDIVRTVRGSMKRFVSLVVITALGATMLTGLSMACIDLRAAADALYARQSLFDISVQSTLGLTQDDIDALARIDGVSAAEGGYQESTYTRVDESRATVTVKALLKSGMNEPYVVDGRLPETADEVAVTEHYLNDSGKSVGDTVSFEDAEQDDPTGLSDEPTAGAIPGGTYTIVGTVVDPANITQPDGPIAFRASTGDDYIFFVSQRAVTPGSSFTIAYLSVSGTDGLSAYSDAYEQRVDQVQKEVEKIAPQRERARTQQIKDDALDEIAAEEADAESQLAEAEQKLTDAQATLDESLQEALDGQRELDSQEASALAQLADAQATIDANAASLASGRLELAQRERAGNAQLAAAQAEIDQGRAQIAAGMLEANANERDLDAAQAQLDDGFSKLEAGQAELDARRNEAQSGLDQAEAGIAQADAQAQALLAQLQSNDATAAWDSLKQATDEDASAAAQQAFITAVENDVANKTAQIDASLDKLTAARDQLTGKLAAAQAQADPGEKRLNEIDARMDEIDARTSQIAARLDAIDARVQDIDAALAGGGAASSSAGNAGGQGAVAAGTEAGETPATDADAQPDAPDASALQAERADLLAERDQLVQEQSALDDEAASLDAERATLEQQLAPLRASIAQLDAALNNQDPAAGNLGVNVQIAALEGQRQQLQALIAPGSSGTSAVAQLAAGMGQATVGRAQAQAGLAEIATAQATLDQNRAALAASQQRLDAGRAQLEAGRATLSASQAQLDAGQDQLTASAQAARALIAQGWAQITSGEQQLAAGQAELDAQRADALAQIASARQQIEDGLAQIADGQAELDENRASFLTERNDARQQIADARADVDAVEDATWYVQDRSGLSSFSSVDSDASSIEAIARIIPVIFFIVAILVSLTTATRMVEEERGLIGLYKALGYSNARILSKYAIYTLAAALIGCILGDVLGFVAIPHVLLSIFSAMYLLPLFSLQFNAFYAFGAVALFVAGIVGSTLISCRNDLRETPAALMRPKAPRAGSRIFLERIRPLWRRLGFLNKVTARNIFRYKKRMLMTIFGIMGCTALLICGFAVKNTVESLAPRQYDQVYRYDLLAVTSADDYQTCLETLDGVGQVTDIQPIGVDNITVEFNGAKESMQLYVIPRGASISPYVTLQTMDGAPISLDQADVVITNNAATVLGLGTGDTVELSDSALNVADATVNAVTLNYLGNAVYMTQDAYERLFGPLELNGFFTHLTDNNDDQLALADSLEGDELFLSVTSVAKMHGQFEQSFTLINVVVYVVIVLAAGLAFVVLFTLSTVNIGEREREIATIKVLGFRKREVRTYINKETFVLTGLGILVGLPAGWALSESFTYILKMPSIFFDVVVDPWCYGAAAALSVVFALAVSFITNRMLDRIIMVEALKSPE